jgi:hypothetical protein
MKRMRFPVGIMLLAAGLASGCSKDDSITVEGPLNHEPESRPSSAAVMPIHQGNRWLYTAEQIEGSQKTDVEVTFTVVEGDGETGSIMVAYTGGASELLGWQTTEDGIFQTSSGGVEFAPPQPLVPFPLDEAAEIAEYAGAGPRPDGTMGPFKMKTRHLGQIEVDTERDRMMTWGVEARFTWTREDSFSGQATTTSFWKENVGLVRMTQSMTVNGSETSFTMRLKEFKKAEDNN